MGDKRPVLEANSAMVWLWDVEFGFCEKACEGCLSLPSLGSCVSAQALTLGPEFGCSYACDWTCIPTWPIGWPPSLTWAPPHHDGLIWRPSLGLLFSSTRGSRVGPLYAWTLPWTNLLPASALHLPSSWGNQTLLLPNNKVISPNKVMRAEI